MVWFVFLLLRVGIPSHTPDIDRLLSRHSTYADGRFAYLGLWGAGLFLFAILLSVLAAIRFGPFQKLETILQGEIRDVAAWYYVFESEPKDAYRYVGCELIDGSYYGGYLDWYNTDPTENIDRELVLAAPLTMRVSGSDNQIPLDEFSRIILSAKQIQKILVSYVDENKK